MKDLLASHLGEQSPFKNISLLFYKFIVWIDIPIDHCLLYIFSLHI